LDLKHLGVLGEKEIRPIEDTSLVQTDASVSLPTKKDIMAENSEPTLELSSNSHPLHYTLIREPCTEENLRAVTRQRAREQRINDRGSSVNWECYQWV
jgi:hypothetical protein